MDLALKDSSKYNKIPSKFYGILDGIIESELKAVTVGAKSIDEALVSIEERGQQQLDQQLAEKTNEEKK
ncbi:hypothetical protein D3C78_1669710 [compost metagenome]